MRFSCFCLYHAVKKTGEVKQLKVPAKPCLQSEALVVHGWGFHMRPKRARVTRLEASGLARASPASRKNQSLDKNGSSDKIYVQEEDILCREGTLSPHSVTNSYTYMYYIFQGSIYLHLTKRKTIYIYTFKRIRCTTQREVLYPHSVTCPCVYIVLE